MWGVRREVVDEERSQSVKMSVKSQGKRVRDRLPASRAALAGGNPQLTFTCNNVSLAGAVFL